MDQTAFRKLTYRSATFRVSDFAQTAGGRLPGPRARYATALARWFGKGLGAKGFVEGQNRVPLGSKPPASSKIAVRSGYAERNARMTLWTFS